MILAQRKGIVRKFDKHQWSKMPQDKYGWERLSEKPATKKIEQLVPEEIIQKKIIGGKVVDVGKNEETIKQPIPDEIVEKMPEKSDKQKRGRPTK